MASTMHSVVKQKMKTTRECKIFILFQRRAMKVCGRMMA